VRRPFWAIRWRKRAFHPLLVALYPEVTLYAANVAIFTVADIWRSAAYAVLAAVGAWVFFGLVLRSASGGAIAASLSFLLFFTYDFTWNPVLHFLARSSLGPTLMPALHPQQFHIWTLGICFLVVLLLANRLKNRLAVTNAFNFAAVALLLMPIGRVLLQEVPSAHGQQSAIQAQVPALAKLPDVYFVIFDAYGRSDALKETFGIDNQPFIDSLTSLGYKVLPRSRANYAYTLLSLAATLNMQYLGDLLPNVAPDESAMLPIADRLNDSRVVQFFKSQGYRTVAITTGFTALHPRVDQTLASNSGMSLFESNLLDPTPIDISKTTAFAFDAHRDRLLNGMRFLDAVSAQTGPKFVFAHILMPHPPFVFGSNGQPRNAAQFQFGDANDFQGGWNSYSTGYVGQLQYLNKIALPVLARLAARPNTIIIVQGDHGSRSRFDNKTIERADLKEPYRNLSAFFGPSKLKAALRDDMSLVNTFRVVLNTQFGQKLPMLPDKSFYNTWIKPFQWVEVTNRTEPQGKMTP
jgi:hypothetical protein